MHATAVTVAALAYKNDFDVIHFVGFGLRTVISITEPAGADLCRRRMAGSAPDRGNRFPFTFSATLRPLLLAHSAKNGHTSAVPAPEGQEITLDFGKPSHFLSHQTLPEKPVFGPLRDEPPRNHACP
jgi:hypothetical protein